MKPGFVVALLIGSIGGIVLQYDSWEIIIISQFLILVGWFLLRKEKALPVVQLLGIFISFIFTLPKPLAINTIEGSLGVFKKVASNYAIVEIDKTNFVVYLDEKYPTPYEGNRWEWWGVSKELKISSIPLLFSFNDYLRHQGITHELEVQKIKVIQADIPVQIIIREWMQDGLSPSSIDAINFLVFGIKLETEPAFLDSLYRLSIVDLFVVSGFHISFLLIVIIKLLRWIYPSSYDEYVAILLLVPYAWMLNFNVSISRALLVPLFSYINRDFLKQKLGKYDRLALVAILLLVVDHHLIFQTGFQFSFVATGALYAWSDSFKNLPGPSRVIGISIGVFFAIVPLILLGNYEILLLSPIFHFLLSFPIIGLFPIAILTLIFHPLEQLFLPIFVGLITLIESSKSLGVPISFGKPSIVLVFWYYVAIGMGLYLSYKRWWQKLILWTIAVSTMIAIAQNKLLIVPFTKVTFIDVDQGDSILIQGPFSQYTILIDTGGLSYIDLATKRLIPYFKALGIVSIDAIFITHHDFDHMGALESLQDNFPIEKIIYNSSQKTYIVNGLILTNLNPIENSELLLEDDNQQSMVLYVNLGGLNYLFTGDATESVEDKILEKYPTLDCDILKIAHHGSNSSSKLNFLELVTPQYAIISVGEKNKYGHPSQAVLDRLNNLKIPVFLTSIHGTITIQSFLNRHIIMTTLS